MALELARVERLYRTYTVTATDEDGAPVTVTAVDVALLPPRTKPTAATTWSPVTVTGGEARVLLAGPDAAGSGALVVPAAGADVWLRHSDTPEIKAHKAERVTVL